MGILDRISSILRANVNAQLDRADDPEQALDLLLAEMGEALGEARGEVRELGAQRTLFEEDRDRNTTLATEWEAKATAAMRLGSEHLAYEALGRKIDYEKNAKAYATQLQAQAGIVEKLEHDVGLLEAKHEGMVRGRAALVARHGGADAGVAVGDAPSVVSQISAIDAANGDRAVSSGPEGRALRSRAREERHDRERWADDGGKVTAAPTRDASRVTRKETA